MGIHRRLLQSKALFDHGGIYLDTDVIVRKSFDDFLDNEAFISFINDYALCTAIVGAKKGSTFIKGIMDMYDKGEFISYDVVQGTDKPRDYYKDDIWMPSNEYWGWYMVHTHPEFKLNNTMQQFKDVVVYPKHYFELGSLTGNYYCRHLNYNSWRERDAAGNGVKNKIKNSSKRKQEENEFFWIVIRRIKSISAQKDNNFYRYATLCKEGKDVKKMR